MLYIVVGLHIVFIFSWSNSFYRVALWGYFLLWLESFVYVVFMLISIGTAEGIEVSGAD